MYYSVFDILQNSSITKLPSLIDEIGFDSSKPMESSSLFAARNQGLESFAIVLRSRNLLHGRTLSFLRDEITKKRERATKCLCNISFEIILPQMTYLLNSLIRNIFSISIDFFKYLYRINR